MTRLKQASHVRGGIKTDLLGPQTAFPRPLSLAALAWHLLPQASGFLSRGLMVLSVDKQGGVAEVSEAKKEELGN